MIDDRTSKSAPKNLSSLLQRIINLQISPFFACLGSSNFLNSRLCAKMLMNGVYIRPLSSTSCFSTSSHPITCSIRELILPCISSAMWKRTKQTKREFHVFATLVLAELLIGVEMDWPRIAKPAPSCLLLINTLPPRATKIPLQTFNVLSL
jgi:hypothetical protein